MRSERAAQRPYRCRRSVTVASMKTQSFRFRGGVARIAAWHGRADVASLAVRGRGPLASASVERLLDRVRAAGYREVVTNALAPAATLPLVDAGFAVRGRLRVLVHDFADLPADDRPDPPRPPQRPRRDARRRPGRVRRVLAARRATGSARPRARRRARTSGSTPRARGPRRLRARSAAPRPTATCSGSRSRPDAQGRGLGRGARHRRAALAAPARRARARTSTRSPTTTARYALYERVGFRRCRSGSACSDGRCDARRSARRASSARVRVASRRVSVPVHAPARTPRRPPTRSSRCSRQHPPWVSLGRRRARCGSTSRPRCSPTGRRTSRCGCASTRRSTTTRRVRPHGRRRPARQPHRRRPTTVAGQHALTATRRAPCYVAFGLAGSDPRPDVRHPTRPACTRSRSRCAPTRRSASFVTWIVVADPAATPPHRSGSRLGLERRRARPCATPTASTDPRGGRRARARRAARPTSRRCSHDAGPMPLTLEVGPETLESWDALAQSRPRASRRASRSVDDAAARATDAAAPRAVRPDRPHLARGGRARRAAPEPAAHRRASARAAARDVSPELAHRVRRPHRRAPRSPDSATCSSTASRSAAPVGREHRRRPTPLAPVRPRGRRRHRAAPSRRARGTRTCSTTDVSPALRAQRLLAALVGARVRARHAARASCSRRPRGWAARRRRRSRRSSTVLAGHPYVQPVTLDDLFTTRCPRRRATATPVDATRSRRTTPARVPDHRRPLRRRRSASSPGSAARSAPTIRRSCARRARARPRAQHRQLEPRSAEADLAVVDTTAADASQASVSTDGRRVTLTARRADVPLSFVNRTATPRDACACTSRARSCSSPTAPTSSSTLPPGHEHRAVRRRGTRVGHVRDDDHAHVGRRQPAASGPPTRVTIRSAVFSGIGRGARRSARCCSSRCGGANHFRRTRRRAAGAATAT